MGISGSIDPIARKYADIFVAKFSEIDANGWQKPWICARPDIVPQNISGRPYKNGNALFLMLAASVKQYRYPLFLTYNQAKNFGANVRKGETSYPVVYYAESVCDAETGHKTDITPEEYRLMDKEEKQQYKLKCQMIKNNVFNLDQTNIAEARPDIIRKLDKKYCSAEEKTIRDTEVLKVDKMLQEQTWLCQIKLSEGDSAYYSISKDFIEVPAKTRFPDQRYFYGTLYHEMAHSTGAPGRLDRDLTGGFGSKLYAGEELVAELSSAIMSCITGLDSTIKEENLQYLKNWSEVITDDPKIIFSAVAKASAAANMICRELKIEQTQGIDMVDLSESANVGDNLDNTLSDVTMAQKSSYEDLSHGIQMHR